MALIDKAKEAAEQGLAQVQAKIDDLQARRQYDAVLRDLGAAYYAKKRSGGPADAVKAALAAVDAHLAARTTAATGGEAGAPTGKPATEKPSPPPGGYGLDDL